AWQYESSLFNTDSAKLHNLVITDDFVRRLFLHTNLGNIGYNCFNRYINDVQTPVISICQSAQADDPSAECSTGPIKFWTPGGRSTYDPLLVRATISACLTVLQFSASYALQVQHGENGIYDHWFS